MARAQEVARSPTLSLSNTPHCERFRYPAKPAKLDRLELKRFLERAAKTEALRRRRRATRDREAAGPRRRHGRQAVTG